nr:hypothetical protein [Tanacetum cinerariifolium]
MPAKMQSPYGNQSRIGLEATRNQRRCRRLFSSKIMKILLHQVKKDWIKPMIAWNNIALIMRNKFDLDTLSMDNLYNNLKVCESKIKSQSNSSSNSKNVAFVSLNNSSSTNEIVNTTHSVFVASSKDQASTVSYADDVMFSFFSNQSNGLQLDNEDLEQIDTDDLEEMDLKWQVTMLTVTPLFLHIAAKANLLASAAICKNEGVTEGINSYTYDMGQEKVYLDGFGFPQSAIRVIPDLLYENFLLSQRFETG